MILDTEEMQEVMEKGSVTSNGRMSMPLISRVFNLETERAVAMKRSPRE